MSIDIGSRGDVALVLLDDLPHWYSSIYNQLDIVIVFVLVRIEVSYDFTILRIKAVAFIDFRIFQEILFVVHRLLAEFKPVEVDEQRVKYLTPERGLALQLLLSLVELF